MKQIDKYLNMVKKQAALIVVGALVMCLIVGLMIVNLPEEKLVFDLADNVGLWQLSDGSRFREVDGAVELIKGPGQLYLVIPHLTFFAGQYDVCVIEGRWPIAFDQAHLLFISPFNQQFNFNVRCDFDTGLAGGWNKRYLDIGSHGAWQGMIKGVLLLPGEGADRIRLKSITFIKPNSWTRLKAIWSAFIRYRDPLLGTCFAMATPILAGKPFNPFVLPIVFGVLVIGGSIMAGVRIFQADQRISKITAIICLVITMLAIVTLDMRNNVFYLKGIMRNVSLYWGKSIQEKRGIVVGDRDFTDFMRFCDENIPLDVRIFNQVSIDLPGTPPNYLAAVQYAANLRPRFYDPQTWGRKRSYYIFYKPKDHKNLEVFQEQASKTAYFDVAPGEKLFQKIELWQPSQYLYQVNIWMRDKDINNDGIELALVSKDKRTVAGKAKYVSHVGEEAIFRFVPSVNFGKGEEMFLQIENKNRKPVAIGVAFGELYREGALVRNGKIINNDLSFRLIYRPKNLALFKRFNNEAFILMDQEKS